MSNSFLAIYFAGWTQIILYACNAVLFGIGLYLLLQRKDREGMIFYTVSTILLFVFATITAVVNTLATVEELGHLTSLDFNVNLLACRVIYLVALQLVDAMAFIILVHRCYNVWNRDFRVVIFPALMMLGGTALFYVRFPRYASIYSGPVISPSAYSSELRNSVAFFTASIALNIAANTLLTLLIVGRLWWFRRRLQQLMPNGPLWSRYTSIIAMTFESGILIPVTLVVYLVFLLRLPGPKGDHAALAVLNVALPQIIAFAPLLITVRAGLGLTVERDQISLASLRDVEFHTRTVSSTSVPEVLTVTTSHCPSTRASTPLPLEVQVKKGQGAKSGGFEQVA
ncbi:hypothetical protein PM082_021206 [Marasmius tenuissimus]|nr:hypothetical protein PM082_021206 [Marasmius tenuissimus]